MNAQGLVIRYLLFLFLSFIFVSPEAINVQRDSGTPREQKEPQEISLQEDLRVNDKIEPYVCGMGLQNNVGEYNCFLNVVIQVGLSFLDLFVFSLVSIIFRINDILYTSFYVLHVSLSGIYGSFEMSS